MEFKLLTEVKDAEGRILVSVENEEKVEANSMKKLEQITEAVNHPTLWHPRHPYLYKVVSSVYQGQMLIDRVDCRQRFFPERRTLVFQRSKCTSGSGRLGRCRDGSSHAARYPVDERGWL